MTNKVSIKEFLDAIRELPEDEPIDDPRKWYRTQKEHWIGWLAEYNGPGAYGRATGTRRDGRYVYNRIVEPKMLLYLIEAAGVDERFVTAARAAAGAAADSGKTMMSQSAAIRHRIPWETVAEALWG